jgi:glycosidase
MWGANDPDNRKPMIWEDIKYEDEVTNPNGSKRQADQVAVNEELQQHYRKLIQLRNALPALQLGDFSTLLVDDKNSLYGFERSYQQQRVRVILNNSDKPQPVTLDRDQLNWQEQLGQQPVTITGNQIRLTIPAKWGAVLLTE